MIQRGQETYDPNGSLYVLGNCLPIPPFKPTVILLTQGVYIWLVGRRVSVAERVLNVYFQLHVLNSIFSVSRLTYTRCDRN